MAKRSKMDQANAQGKEVNLSSAPEDIEIKLNCTKVFYKNFNADKQLVINRGGAGSSKSHSIMQLLIYKFLTEENKKILILRKALPSLRISILLLFYQLIDQMGVREDIIEEKVFLNFWYHGNLIHFGSVDDVEKIKSSEWNYIWMEEATEFSFDDFKTIRLRLRSPSADKIKNQMFLSFNPMDEFHWIKEKLINDPTQKGNLLEIVSNYKDNPFLEQDYLDQLLALEFQDRAFFDIYTRGEWGKFGNLIYDNWRIASLTDWPRKFEKVAYGLDFGYNDPTSLTQVGFIKNEVWERQLLYARKLTNADLIERLKDLIQGEERRHIIWADAAEPDRIEEIRRTNLFKIKPALKNIKDGIDTVKRFSVNISEDSPDIIKEKRAYSWKKDRNGNVLDDPVDFLNHLMDAERYAIYSTKRGGGGVRITQM